MVQDELTYRRAASAAMIGLLVQSLLALVTAVLGLYAQSPAVQAAAGFFFAGLPIWAVLWALYHQHRLECQEALDAERLGAADTQAGALFDEHADDLRLARRRLGYLYRWGLHGASLIQGSYLLIVGGMMLDRGYQAAIAHRLGYGAMGDGASTLVLMSVTAVVGFVAFVVARYESGMTKNTAWQLLRGGAGYLMGSCFTAILLFVGALFAHYQNPLLLGALRLVIPCLMMVIGAEVIISLALGAYRPRRFGEVVRPAFDSRLLGWMTSPGSIAQAVSEAINYQFGLEVSSNWFYKLLNRAVLPLLLFGAATLILISGVVIVSPHQQAIVTRLGRIHDAPLEPGLHLKLPWPIDRVQKYEVGRVHQVLIGSVSEPIKRGQAVLWDSQHADQEDYLITASAPIPAASNLREGNSESSGLGLALVGAQIAVQYRIADLMQYVTAAADGPAMLTAISRRRTNAYFVTQTIDALIGSGRVAAGRQIRRQIQIDADAMRLGLEVLFVGLISVHPPSEQGVATAFLQQIGAMQMRQSMIEQAQQEANQTLASVAGSPVQALQIDRAIVDLQQSSHTGDQQIKVEKLLTAVRGQAARIIYEARAGRWQRSVAERAAAERFSAQVLAYRNAPDYYRARRYLDALASGLVNARKYVLTAGIGPLPIFRIDLKDDRSTIDSILDQGP